MQATSSNFPKYIDQIFLTKCLEKGLGDRNVNIKEFDIDLGSDPGDNYTSFLYRISISYKTLDRDNCLAHLIVKSMPTDGDRQTFEDMDLFEKEKNAYFQLLPKVHVLLNNTQIAPKCYFATRDPVPTIVFEDLKALGYKLADRVAGVDESHCLLVLKKLAKYHAASRKILENTDHFKDIFKTGVFTRDTVNTSMCEMFYKKNLQKAAEIVASRPGFQHFAPKLLTVYNNYTDAILKSTTPYPDDFLTINHGDLWVGNILFDYNQDRTVKDCLFVDFQATFINSPAFDINTFFTTSTQLDVLQKKEELITKGYYPTLKDSLESLGQGNIPSLEKIINEVRNHELFSLFTFFGDFPLITLSKEESQTSSWVQFADEELASVKRNVGMSSKRFLDAMEFNLKRFEFCNVFKSAINT